MLMDERLAVDVRMSVVSSRAASIGLLYPSEGTIVTMLATIAVAGRELWSAEVWFQHLQALKFNLRAKRKIHQQVKGRAACAPKKLIACAADFLKLSPVPAEFVPIDPPVSRFAYRGAPSDDGCSEVAPDDAAHEAGRTSKQVVAHR